MASLSGRSSRPNVNEQDEAKPWLEKTPVNVKSVTSIIATAPTYLRPAMAVLKPSFLSQRRKPRKLHPTSYLDGLRGVAALFVCGAHYVSQYFPYLEPGWGSTEGEAATRNYLIQLPIIRVVYSGKFMVMIFFVISGYVLSHKSLGLARQKQFGTLFKSLSSSVFRRWLRLMLPALASTLVSFALTRAGIRGELHAGWENWDEPQGEVTGGHFPDRKATIFAQFIDWFEDQEFMVNPFRFGNIQWPKYGIPLWTMQVEYMGSMLVFITCLGVVYLRPKVRLSLLFGLLVYDIWSHTGWLWSLFICGVLLAELSHADPGRNLLPLDVREDREEKPAAQATPNQGMKRYVMNVAAFVFVIFLGTYPEQSGDKSPGFRHLAKLIPERYEKDAAWYYPLLAAMLLVFTLENAKSLQKIFTTPVAQYLGDISLAFYMLHAQVELALGNWLIPFLVNRFRGTSPFDFAFAVTGKSPIYLLPQ
jgi:peptidoglycan/LPS O-acetylase OafA/YrhL